LNAGGRCIVSGNEQFGRLFSTPTRLIRIGREKRIRPRYCCSRARDMKRRRRYNEPPAAGEAESRDEHFRPRGHDGRKRKSYSFDSAPRVWFSEIRFAKEIFSYSIRTAD